MDLVDLEDWLKYYFDCCSVLEDGSVIHYRHRVATIDGRVKIEIYSNDHNPPHFHVRYQDTNASFKLDTGNFLVGKISKKDTCKIKEWHKFNKEYLIKCWEKTRMEK
jgi:hypothetical protein